MFLVTHLLASWVVAAKTTENPRDCRLIALSGILPDVDGLGAVLDRWNQAVGHRQTFFYGQYHHLLLHGLFGGLIIAAFLAVFARNRWRVALLALGVFHLHLLCDLVGSRGPSPEDLWPVFYFGPLSKETMWLWKGQWPLTGWPNRILSVVLFGWALGIAVRPGESFVSVFNRRADALFVGVLRKWRSDWQHWRSLGHS